MFYQNRVEPLLLKLIPGGRLRDTLLGVTDEQLVELFNDIVALTQHVPRHYFNWGRRWNDNRIKQFIDTHTQKQT
jgi:hypothetical protein